MLTIDGSMGEGGGQILRSALALSLHENKPFHIVNIRNTRKIPGLRPQHLAAIKAASQIGAAEVIGATLGSRSLTFRPKQIITGTHCFDIGTAGSAVLVLQTVIPALLTSTESSHLVVKGGTHNPLAPTFDFFNLVFVPLINRMGGDITANLQKYGFYPAGGGVIDVRIEPRASLQSLQLLERGEIMEEYGYAVVANLPNHIAERELNVMSAGLGLAEDKLETRHVVAGSPGNVVAVIVRSRHVTEVFTGIGERGLRAELVAGRVVAEVDQYVSANVPVGAYLADQLLLPMVVAGGGSYLTLPPSRHTTTNIDVVKKFLDVDINVTSVDVDAWCVELV